MATIKIIDVDPAWTVPEVWSDVALQVCDRLQTAACPVRDAVVLLPFAALLAPLRAAFAAVGGWLPRVETTRTLAASLAPPRALVAGACCGDMAIDRLNAAMLLRRQPWGGQLAQEDGAGFMHAVLLVVDAAQTLLAAGAAQSPADRPAWWANARQGFGLAAAAGESAAAESRLLAVAVDWAAFSCADVATDVLFDLAPSAWVLVHVGGPDPLAEAVARSATVPAWRVMLDPPAAAVLAGLEPEAALSGPGPVDRAPPAVALADAERLRGTERWLCVDFEAEATAAASLVIEAVNAGRTPVALVALDRALVRRVRALLERQALPLIDETGWLLATTIAGAQVMALLRAALALQAQDIRPPPTPQGLSSSARDPLLNWMKTWPAGAQEPPAAAKGIDALEALWRGRRRRADPEAASATWRHATQALMPMAQQRSMTLAEWVQALHGALASSQVLPELLNDAAGRQVLTALRLDGDSAAAWVHVAQSTSFKLHGFVDWVLMTLEQTPFLPLPDDNAVVVLTPLARAFGRAFGHTVVPGADHQQLGHPARGASLIGPQAARVLGLADAANRHLQQRLALLHLMRAPRVSFTRRQRNGAEPLAEGPDLAWLFQPAMRGSTGSAPPWRTWEPVQQAVAAAPVLPPQAVAQDRLPARLSASQLEAFRQCPYRFFARAVLLLDEPDELDTALAKRDYGNWLHLVLHQFHSQRDHRLPPEPQLQAAADWATAQQGLDASEMLPWRASFTHFCPAYLQWLTEREAQGWYWADGETDLDGPPDALPGTRLRGRIDRLDHGPKGEQQVIDYKTGAATGLRSKVAQPLEDTQLAFYAALLGSAAAEQGELLATYLALDEADGPVEVHHPQVAQTVRVMLPALAQEWQRMREGEPLQALGEGSVCETCEARGLCRRDHWAAPVLSAEPVDPC